MESTLEPASRPTALPKPKRICTREMMRVIRMALLTERCRLLICLKVEKQDGFCNMTFMERWELLNKPRYFSKLTGEIDKDPTLIGAIGIWCFLRKEEHHMIWVLDSFKRSLFDLSHRETTSMQEAFLSFHQLPEDSCASRTRAPAGWIRMDWWIYSGVDCYSGCPRLCPRIGRIL